MNTTKIHETLKTELSQLKALENLFLAINYEVCTGSTTEDNILMNTKYAVSLLNHFRSITDTFRPMRVHQRC